MAFALAALAAAGACTRSSDPAARAGLGRAVSTGPARALRASPDGAWLAYLDGCREARGQFLPPQTASCDLRVVPAQGGASIRVAGAVTTLPQGFAWSPEGGVLAAAAEYDYLAGASTLVLWRPGGAPTEVARDVTFYGFSPRGDLALVSAGRLLRAGPGGAPAPVQGAAGVATFEFSTSPSAGGRALVARRAASAGGELLAVGERGAEPIAAGVTEYAVSSAGDGVAFVSLGAEGSMLRFAPSSGGPPRLLARGARTFAFAPGGGALAYLSDAAPGKQGDLHVVDPRRPAAHPADEVLGREVGEFRWAARAPRLAWLEGYDPRVRSGTLGVGGQGLAPRKLGKNVSDFDVTPDGTHVAFLQHTTRGGFSVDLALAPVGEEGAKASVATPPATVAAGVFGFAFSPDGKWLYYRTRCTRNAEACDLERVPASGLAPGAKPTVIAAGMKSFDFDPRDPGRLLIGFQRMDLQALDIAVWDGTRLVAVDQAVLPGSAQFLGPDSRRLAYVVIAPKRAGVHVAAIP